MNITEKVLESYNKLSEEEQRSFLPALKKFAKYAETDKKIYESKQNFFIQFTGIVGVVFGILAAFGNMGENYVADWFYLVGIGLSLLCLVFCIIGIFQPTYILQKTQEQNLNDLVNEFEKAAAKQKGQKSDFQEEKVKISPIIELIPRFAYYSFIISLICFFIQHIILFKNTSYL